MASLILRTEYIKWAWLPAHNIKIFAFHTFALWFTHALGDSIPLALFLNICSAYRLRACSLLPLIYSNIFCTSRRGVDYGEFIKFMKHNIFFNFLCLASIDVILYVCGRKNIYTKWFRILLRWFQIMRDSPINCQRQTIYNWNTESNKFCENFFPWILEIGLVLSQ